MMDKFPFIALLEESYRVAMDRLAIALALLATCLIGLFRILRDLKSVSDKAGFVTEFLGKLNEYFQSSGNNSEAYGWLIHRSNKMQNQLGFDGLVSFRPPFANYMHNNYPVVLNILPELRRTLGDSLLSGGDLPHQYAMLLHDALVRHTGKLHDFRENTLRELRNPIIWMREGFRAVVGLPFSLLGWLGVLSKRRAGLITSSRLFGLLAGFAGLVGFVSAVMGIALGWGQFVTLVVSWRSKFF